MDQMQIAEAAVANIDTAQLMLMAGLINAQAVKSDEDKIMASVIADTVAARHNLIETLDAICEDVDYEGTYYDALVLELAIRNIA
jgi:hypothetical protein